MTPSDVVDAASAVARPVRRGSQSGFSLIEVIVAFVVLALVLAAATGALKTIGDGFGTGIERSRALSDMALARDVLRRQTARAVPLNDGTQYLFQGTPTTVAFVIAEPPAPGRGGFAAAKFVIETSPAGQRLVYMQRPFPGGPEHRSVLAEGPYGFRLAYLEGRIGAPPRWREDWHEPRALPLLIRLEMSVDGSVMPASVVPLRADADRGCVPALGGGFCSDVPGGASWR